MNHNLKSLLNRIHINPGIFDGKPIIRGMRICVETVLELMAQGVPEKEILEDYPDLESEDILACLAYAHSVIANEM